MHVSRARRAAHGRGAHPAAPGRDGARCTSARGRILAEDIVATRALPAFDNSAMDGYAVARRASCRRRCRSSAQVAAGQMLTDPIPERVAIRIFTGAPMPAGLDTVVIQEDAKVDGSNVTLPASPAGDNVRRAGEDIAAGDLACRRRRRGSAPASSACSRRSGIAEVPVARAPRVALIATGDELVDSATRPAPGQIVDSSAHACSRAMIPAAAVCPLPRHRASDDPIALAALIASAIGSRRRDHDRRRLRRRSRPRARRAHGRGRRARALEGRDEAGQAVLVRHERPRRRCSACRATRCRRSSRSSCSCARRCSRCRARAVTQRPRAPVHLVRGYRKQAGSRALHPRQGRAQRRVPDRAPAPQAGLRDAVVARRLQRARRAAGRVDRDPAQRIVAGASCWRPYERTRQRITVEAGDEGRVDKALARHFPDAGPQQLAELFDDGDVRVARQAREEGRSRRGRRRHRARARAGQRRRAAPASPIRRRRSSTSSSSGPTWSRSPSPRASRRSRCAPASSAPIANGIAARWPECADDRRRPARRRPRPPPRHRHVGRAVAARTAEAYRALREAFGQGRVEKHYLAITDARPVSRECDAPLVQRGEHVARRSHRRPRRVHRSSSSSARPRPHALVRCLAQTGRMHQVRAHLAHVGAPIAGDALYGGKPLAGHDGFFLHAASLRCRSAARRSRLRLPVPARFAAALAAAGLDAPQG